MTQVSIDFIDAGCGTGSAAWSEYDIGIELRWVDSRTLEVTYPAGTAYRHNASGDYLVCLDDAVRVVMVPRSLDIEHGRPYSAPVEGNHTPSPTNEIVAYTLRYDSPCGGITQVIVDVLDTRGCQDSTVTFYDADVDVQLNWTSGLELTVYYTEGSAYT